MISVIENDWHLWESPTIGNPSNVLVSNEETKTLTQHANIQAAVNHIWFNDKESARKINAALKGE